MPAIVSSPSPTFRVAPRARAALRLLATGLIATCLAACQASADRDAMPVPVSIQVEHTVRGAPLVLGREFEGPGPAPLRVTRLSYYVGQFRLQRDDGQWFTSASTAADAPGDYQLVDASKTASQSFEALRVPPGRYKTLEFLLGVDATRNSSGAQTGALDPAGGMFWTWKSGYIFFALEGESSASGADDHALTFHIGGDAGLARTLVLPLAAGGLVVEAGKTPVLRLHADVARFFEGLPLATTHTVMSPKGADGLADRYAGLFSVDPAPTTVARSP